MRKIFVVVLLLVSCQLMGQENWKYRAAVNAGFYFGGENLEQASSFTLEYGYIFKNRLLLGVGAGYEYSQYIPDGPKTQREYIPLYADVKCYMSLSEKVRFLAGVETGCAMAIQPKVMVRDIPNEFLVYPQIGFDVKLYKMLSLELSGGYRSSFLNLWGFNVGLKF